MRENGASPVGCRERCTNSNAPIVETAPHSGFVVAIAPATVEIFSAENPACRPGCDGGEPLCRRKPEHPRKALGIVRPDLGVDDARRPLAVERVEHLLGGYPAHVL